MHPFGEWAPDNAEFNNDLLAVARNVFPRANSYGPVADLLAQSINALPSACKGMWFVQLTDGSYATYTATASRLYRYNAATASLEDASRLVGGTYSCPADDFWSGTQFGNKLIVTQLGDDVQVIDVDLGGNFEALGGSPPRSRFITSIDDRVMLANTTSNPRSISWSDINDSEEWTLGLADTQEFPEHGAVMGVFPHARLVMLERGMRSLISTGDALSFEFPELATAKGTAAPWGAVEVGDTLYWLSDDGLYAGNANGHQNISDGKVTEYLFNSMNRARTRQIVSTFDPYSPRLYFAYPTTDTEYNDRILVYDRSLNRFSEIVLNTYFLARLATAATTLESIVLPLDDPSAPSLDSHIYMAGAPVIVAVGTDRKLSILGGPLLSATLEPCTFQFEEDARSLLQQATLTGIGNLSTATLRVAKRSTLSDSISFGTPQLQQASGKYPLYHDGAYHDIEWSVPAGAVWSHLIGWNERHVRASER